MTNIIIPPEWQLKEKDATPENIYFKRRELLRAMGFVGVGGLSLLSGCNQPSAESELGADPTRGSGKKATGDSVKADPQSWKPSPMNELVSTYTRNGKYRVPERGVTDYKLASTYNNYYEFTTNKTGVWKLAKNFTTKPWQVKIHGLIEKPITIDNEDLIKQFSLEERIYRFRCVEAWSMTVPWIGFPMAEFVKWCKPTSKAKYISFKTVMRPEEMPGQKNEAYYTWPYYEGLRMDEAMNELSLMAVGMYDKKLPNQNGAPLRTILPWKYGFKSIKSIVEIKFTSKQPHTFWNDAGPREYGFYSNVEPKVTHPRWSQASERLIDTGDRIKTLPYNGYSKQVAQMYKPTGKIY